MPKKEAEFFDADLIRWVDVPGTPGQTEKILSKDPKTGSYTRMLHFSPGCRTTMTLTHDFWEEVYILEGSIRDTRLNQTFSKGMYACRPPGMPHGPWVSQEGCTTFEVRYRQK